jgi:adenine-specific DNA glycosylase
LGIKPAKTTLLCTVKHSITRYRITLEAFTVESKTVPAKLEGVWKSPAQMEQLAFTSAHRKILQALTGK